MTPKIKAYNNKNIKKSRKAITLETKQKILQMVDSGLSKTDICRVLGMSSSTVCTILKSREKIEEQLKNAAPLQSTVIRHRTTNVAEMEKVLIIWMRDEIERGGKLSMARIQGKAVDLFNNIIQDKPHSEETFVASPGWFCRFKRRYSLSNVKIDGSARIPSPNISALSRQVPDLNERLGMDGSSSSGKNDGASSSFLTCSPLISSMPGIHEDVLSSGAGPSSSALNCNENEGDYDEDVIDVKTEPVFNVESEICEEENSQSNTQSSSDRRSHQSSPTPSMIGPYLLKKETHCTTILDQLLRDDTFSDVTLTAEGQSIRAHKIVLCLASAYFRQVLSKESNVQNVIVFRDVKFAELKNLINFIYTGEATVDAADLESFMKTAEMLEVTSLCDGHRNFPKNLLPKTRESETEKTSSSTPSKTTFPATKRSHAFSSAASNGSPPTKSRKTDGKDSSKKSSSVLPHPSTSGGGGGSSVPSNSIIEPMTIIKTEPMSEDSIADEEYELRVGADVSFESLTRSPPPLTQPSPVSTDLDENQSPPSDQSPSSSTSLEKVPVGKCPLCPITQPTRKGSEMTKHLYAQHPDKTVFCCESCSRVFLKKGSFEAHKNDCVR